jgi:hypothetical protein
MDHSGTPEHGIHVGAPATHAAAGGHPAFPDAEWQAFRREDKTAGQYIIGLMVSIFIIGLLLYIGVAWSVATRATY